jgi:hypothetical protein
MFNPDSRGLVLVALEQLRDLAAHLAHLRLLLVPQQLDPRHGHLERNLALVGLEALVQDARQLALVHLGRHQQPPRPPRIDWIGFDSNRIEAAPLRSGRRGLWWKV